MTRAHRRRNRLVVATGIVVSLATFSGLPATAVPDALAGGGSASPEKASTSKNSDALAKKLGFQLVPKRTSPKQGSGGSAQTDPRLSLLSDPSRSDLSYWKSALQLKSTKRTAAMAKREPRAIDAVDPLLVDETELDSPGGNDGTANAQRITKFGSAADKRPAARILGTVSRSLSPRSFSPVEEDNGAIGLAGETGLVDHSSVRTTGTVGDGAHGSAGDGKGDFDFYAIRGAKAGQRLLVDIDAVSLDASNGLDSGVILWDANGKALAGNDDDGTSRDSLLSVALPADGDYYISVTSFDSLPDDPFDSGSGTGFGKEGNYAVTFGLTANDVDYYAVNLKAGDILSASSTGVADQVTFFDPEGQEVFGSSQDFSGIYPILSPLAGGGNAVADHVAPKDGRYYVAIEGKPGKYDVTLEVFRPNTETKKVTQTIFLDFDGQRVNTAIFGGRGVSKLSPLSTFLSRWGISASQEDALIDRTVATVTENLKKDFADTGTKIKILNSRDHADPFGQADVSRLIIGGTIDESGVDTIGIAQSIDPGNFDTQETALILLDVLSDPADPDAVSDPSLNGYITAATDRVKFVGTALGNVASHEAGHYLGNWHVDQFDTVLNLMDQGGNFPLLFGVGVDGVGGTADDPDVDFGVDTLNPNEGFTGLENTTNRVRRALAP
jgi:hypothetical protein